MAVLLILSLFTARIVFNELGEQNYGIYNLVGGIIVFFSFLNSGLSNATRRYITVEIETGTDDSRRKIFNNCFISHILISIIIAVLAETIGLWFVNAHLNIPAGREFAANIVYQLSVITAIIGILQTPFQATIISYERMNIYAYITVFDVIFKLLIIFLIQYVNYDKLIVYAVLVFISGCITSSMYMAYCHREFRMCRWRYKKDYKSLKEIFNFTGWSLFGQASVVATNQGVSVLINIFTSVVVNAAMGIANTIINLVNNFITNFQTAFNPAITKSFASNDITYLNNLIIRTSKLSSYLLLIFAVPVILECENILTLWLGNYPQYAPEFCKISLGYLYLEAISAPLWMVIYSNKNIREYQIMISSAYFLNFIFSWLLLYLDYEPYFVIIVRVLVNIILVAVRLIYCKKLLPSFHIKTWGKNIVIRGIVIVSISSLLPIYLKSTISAAPLLSLAITGLSSISITVPLIYCYGLDSCERRYAINLIKNKLHIK